jgi:hypothetical protein
MQIFFWLRTTLASERLPLTRPISPATTVSLIKISIAHTINSYKPAETSIRITNKDLIVFPLIISSTPAPSSPIHLTTNKAVN